MFPFGVVAIRCFWFGFHCKLAVRIVHPTQQFLSVSFGIGFTSARITVIMVGFLIRGKLAFAAGGAEHIFAWCWRESRDAGFAAALVRASVGFGCFVPARAGC